MRYILSAITLLILSACISLRDFDEPLFPWVERWLDSATCIAPCWESIIPGETSINILNEETIDPANRLGFYPSPTLSDGQRYSYWFNLDGEEKFHGVTVFTSSEQDETINRIQFEFGNYGAHLKVSDVIAHFGNPTSVGVDLLAGGCRATMLYPKQHIWLTLERKKLRKVYAVAEDTLLSWSYFYSQSTWDNALKRFTKPEQIQPWIGYEKYVCKKVW